MKKPSFSKKQLILGLVSLYSGLKDLRHEAPGIWPLSELEEDEYHDFFQKLQDLATQCMGMHGCFELPEQKYRMTMTEILMDYPDMIRFTRELIWCCDMDLITEYRQLVKGEYETIRLLEQTHAQLIGAFYVQRPGEETLGTDQFRMIR
jgi:hypothetical protein